VHHPTEKANGIAHEYAWLDKHPDVCFLKRFHCGVCQIYSVKKLDIIAKNLYYYCGLILIGM